MIRALGWALACAVTAGGATAQEQVQIGTGAVLRWLDKINSETRDIEIRNASSDEVGTLRVELGECRYPEGNPSGDAYAFLTIHVQADPRPVFSGWMVASSPALNPLEHARYDLWVLRCTTE